MSEESQDEVSDIESQKSSVDSSELSESEESVDEEENHMSVVIRTELGNQKICCQLKDESDPDMKDIPEPTLGKLFYHIKRKIGVEPQDVAMRWGYGPPKRMDATLEMTLETLGIKDWGILTMVTRPREAIDVGLVVGMDDAKMAKLSENVWLSAVDAFGLTAISDPSLKSLSHCKQLTWLDVSYSAITDNGIESLAVLPRLETFNALNCQNLKDSAGAQLAKIESLTCIDLSWCKSLTSSCVKPLAGLPALSSLQLIRCESMFKGSARANGDFVDWAMDALSKSTSLTNLNVSQCRHITDRTIMNLVCGEQDPASFGDKNVPGCSSLTRLDMSYCGKCTDASVLKLLHLPNLASVDFAWIAEITSDAVQTLLTKRPTVRDINLSGCNKIPQSRRDMIVKVKGEGFHMRQTDMPRYL